MSSVLLGILVVVGAIFGVVIAAVLVIYLIVPIFRGIGWVISRIIGFIGGEIADLARVVGSLITALVLMPLVLGTVVIGRWSASTHYARAIQREFATMGACVFRILIGHPAYLFGLTALTEGLEHRIPEVVRGVPGPDKPNPRVGQFDGYKIIGSLTGGGSGGKLYIAEPDAIKRASFDRQGFRDVDQVVIKVFSLHDGSTLPQIIRESRALEAAKKLGFVLDHDLSPERFFYITRYVPGESLGVVTQQLHAVSPNGLEGRGLGRAIKYAADLLGTLETYHRGGLWHKDIKPDNIVVFDDTAHVVDLGLVTPLRSAMTLTTHGTEYFRDPEMVRMALRGVKVHQVDGAKFDIYAAGAVLFSLIENSFPAHGGLSQITKRCPESVRWIVRRAMADYDKRYATASEMLADLEVVVRAKDPFSVKPIDLPSVGGNAAGMGEVPPSDMPADGGRVDEGAAFRQAGHAGVAATAAAGVGAAQGAAFAGRDGVGNHVDGVAAGVAAGEGRKRTRPLIKLTDWWSGAYHVQGDESVAAGSPKRAREVASAAVASVANVMHRAADHLGRGDGGRGEVGRGEVAGVDRRAPYAAAGAEAGMGANGVRGVRRSPQVRAIPERARRPAAEQLRSARERAAAARERARARMRPGGAGHIGRERRRDGRGAAGPNAGMAVVAGVVGVAVLIGVGVGGSAINSAIRDGARARVAVGVSEPVILPLGSEGEAASVDAAAGGVRASSGGEKGAASGGGSGLATASDVAKFQQRVSDVMQVTMSHANELQTALRDAGELAGIAAQSPGGRIVIVNDALPPLSRSARSAINGAIARLIAFEFELVGNVAGIDVEGEELERQISLIAAVRNARGQQVLGSDACNEAMTGFLESRPESGDAIVWISPTDDGEAPAFHVYLARKGERAERELLRETLRAALTTSSTP